MIEARFARFCSTLLTYRSRKSFFLDQSFPQSVLCLVQGCPNPSLLSLSALASKQALLILSLLILVYPWSRIARYPFAQPARPWSKDCILYVLPTPLFHGVKVTHQQIAPSQFAHPIFQLSLLALLHCSMSYSRVQLDKFCARSIELYAVSVFLLLNQIRSDLAEMTISLLRRLVNKCFIASCRALHIFSTSRVAEKFPEHLS
jgi:hypothetical protein